jgi:hypothetical protein
MFAANAESPDAVQTPSGRAAAPPPCSPRLWLGADQCLWLEHGSAAVRVRAVRCFPWSAPGELVSLRDDSFGERLLVASPSELDGESAIALAAALRGAGFVLQIETIESVEEDFEVRVWRTRTRHGRRTFQTRLDEWPWPSPDGGHLVRDIAGDLFRLPPPEGADSTTQRWLWAYVG